MTEETATKGELLDWTSVKVHNEFAGGALLVIEGDAPVPMRVELRPLPIGIAPVDYQSIELRGHRGDFGPEVVEHFRVQTHMKDLPHGRIGIVLIGATMREYVPPKGGLTATP